MGHGQTAQADVGFSSLKTTVPLKKLPFWRIYVRSHVEILLRNFSFQGSERKKKQNQLWTTFHKLSKFHFMQTSDKFQLCPPTSDSCFAEEWRKGKRDKVHFPFASLVKKYSCSFYYYHLCMLYNSKADSSLPNKFNLQSCTISTHK